MLTVLDGHLPLAKYALVSVFKAIEVTIASIVTSGTVRPVQQDRIKMFKKSNKKIK